FNPTLPRPPMLRCNCSLTEHATTVITTLSLHDALPIYQHDQRRRRQGEREHRCRGAVAPGHAQLDQLPHHDDAATPGLALPDAPDRKSTRLNSSHVKISYAVVCLRKQRPAVMTGHATTC